MLTFAPQCVCRPYHFDIKHSQQGYWIARDRDGLVGGLPDLQGRYRDITGVARTVGAAISPKGKRNRSPQHKQPGVDSCA
jgi:hypothetical protein